MVGGVSGASCSVSRSEQCCAGIGGVVGESRGPVKLTYLLLSVSAGVYLWNSTVNNASCIHWWHLFPRRCRCFTISKRMYSPPVMLFASR